MKRLLIFIVLCFSLVLSYGQTFKGKSFVSLSTGFQLGNELEFPFAGIGFGTVKDKSDDPDLEGNSQNFTRLNLRPRFGLFLTDDFAAGLDVSVGYSRNKLPDEDITFSQSSFLVGPFLRYYLPMGKAKFFIEGLGALGNLNESFTFDTSTDEAKSSLSRFATYIGVAFPLSDRFMLDSQLGYESIQINSVEDNPNNNRLVHNSLAFQFGMTFMINK